jgi:hypothetical protein
VCLGCFTPFGVRNDGWGEYSMLSYTVIYSRLLIPSLRGCAFGCGWFLGLPRRQGAARKDGGIGWQAAVTVETGDGGRAEIAQGRGAWRACAWVASPHSGFAMTVGRDIQFYSKLKSIYLLLAPALPAARAILAVFASHPARPISAPSTLPSNP